MAALRSILLLLLASCIYAAMLPRRAVVTSFAAACLGHSAPARAAEQQSPPPTSQEVRGSVNGVPAVVASEAEAIKLAKEAQELQLPNVPPNSDLAKLLSGSAPVGSVSDPRAHSN